MTDHPAVTFREDIRASDPAAIRGLVAATGFFSDCETELATELVQARLSHGPASGYQFLLAEKDGRLAAYTAYGHIDCTAASWDLYWIAAAPDLQGRGLGRAVLAATEERIRAAGGRRLYAETSSRPLYEPTRIFYERTGFILEARIEDFYAEGDSKLMYVKRL